MSHPDTFSLEDPAQPSSQPREEALEGAADTLLHRSLVNRAQAARNVIAFLEVLGVNGAALDGPQVRDSAQLLLAQAVRPLEFGGCADTSGPAHEVAPDGQ